MTAVDPIVIAIEQSVAWSCSADSTYSCATILSPALAQETNIFDIWLHTIGIKQVTKLFVLQRSVGLNITVSQYMQCYVNRCESRL